MITNNSAEQNIVLSYNIVSMSDIKAFKPCIKIDCVLTWNDTHNSITSIWKSFDALIISR